MNLNPSAQCLTIRYGRLVDSLVTPCAVSRAWEPRSSLPQPDSFSFEAVLDTGAVRSGVSTNVVETCGLRPMSFTAVNTAHGVIEELSTFLVNIWLPPGIAIAGLPVIGIDQMQNADIVIGIDIIGQGDFAVTNADQETIVTFRFPPQGGIDFEADLQQPLPPDDERGFMTRYPIGFGRGPRRSDP